MASIQDSASRGMKSKGRLFDAAPPRPRLFSTVNPIGFYSLVRREVLRELRWFGMVIVGPAVQAVLFASVLTLAAADRLVLPSGLDFLAFLATGLILSSVMQRAVETTGYSIMFDKLESDGLQDILGAPLSSLEILTAYLVTSVLTSLSIGIAIWLAMVLFGLGLPVNPLGTLFFATIAAAIFSAIGLIAAIFSRKWDSFSGFETFLILPAVFLSGTFFPLSAVPEGAWQTVFQLNPIFYLINGFRWGVLGVSDADPWVCAGVALAALSILLVAASRLLASGYKLKP